ncbi:MAG TPA: CocE/NonD family hydrolase, partial [Chthonomonadaceae bacterium]|nr:CocE/NonD family hydrolase [Chthonomonadaceae bacterium]
VFPGGVFKKAMIEDWLKGTNHAPNSLAFWTKHPIYDDFWKQRDLTRHWERANVPAIHIGGWYDIFSQATLDAFEGYQTKGGPSARLEQKLVMGPWTHGVGQATAGDLTFPNGSAPPNNALDPFRWFDAWLKDKDNGMKKLPAVTYYVMGDVTDKSAPGNVWRTANAWPPVKTRATPFYLHADHSLSTSSPTTGDPLTYTYDPKDPVTTVGGPQLTIPAGPMDQRKIETRPDVLVFSSDPLTQPMEVTGHVLADLFIASDAPDTDFFVKLCDVYPDGRSINICEGQLRARFRDGFDKEHLLKPGEITPLKVDLWSTSMIFNKGHRLRVQVTSSSSPGYDPNPNTGDPFRANDRVQVAHNTVFLAGENASFILLPVAR